MSPFIKTCLLSNTLSWFILYCQITIWKLQLSFELQQWASTYLLLNSFQGISLKNLLKDCRLLLIKWGFSRYPRGAKKSHNGDSEMPTSMLLYSQCAQRHSLNTRKVCHQVWTLRFLSFGGFRIQSMVSSSEVQFSSGSFGFVPAWTAMMWPTLLLGACKCGIWEQKAQTEQLTRT